MVPETLRESLCVYQEILLMHWKLSKKLKMGLDSTSKLYEDNITVDFSYYFFARECKTLFCVLSHLMTVWCSRHLCYSMMGNTYMLLNMEWLCTVFVSNINNHSGFIAEAACSVQLPSAWICCLSYFWWHCRETLCCSEECEWGT